MMQLNLSFMSVRSSQFDYWQPGCRMHIHRISLRTLLTMN